MRKCVLVCAVILVLSVLAAPPAKAATTFNFGVKAGLSYSNVFWSDDDGSERGLFRSTFGAFALINLTPMIAIQPEVNFLTMGESWEGMGERVVERMNYLHIPVLVRARLMREGKFVPVVFAGPAIGILLSAKENEFDMTDILRSTDFGAELGLGGEFGLGAKMKGLIDLRFYLGLSNNFDPDMILTSKPMMIIEDFKEKNRALVLTFGLIF